MIITERLERLIENFEFDRRKTNTLDENLLYFLQDLRYVMEEICNESNEKIEEARESGYEEGYDEGEKNANSDLVEIEYELEDFEDALNSLKSVLEDRLYKSK